MKIALAGNPNSGKTTMFNALTGRNEKVGNWAGVTVDKKEGYIRNSFHNRKERITAVDLPGAYSMSPFTSEESVTSEYVKNENPDVIINIVDAANLSRSLFFTTQLLELGIPTVVALNKSDIIQKKNTAIDAELLGRLLGCPVVKTSSVNQTGLSEVVTTAIKAIGKTQSAPFFMSKNSVKDKQSAKEADVRRFDFVNSIVSSVEVRSLKSNQINIQDRIDILLTNRFIGIFVFALVMWFVFWLSQASLGPWLSESILVPVIDGFGALVSSWMSGTSPILRTIVVDGIVGGVSAVVGFLPLVMVMYFFIALLEDCGYMARATVVLDPIFKKVGLSGKSVIPFVIGTGCAIPGIMACRTIRNERERRATALLAPFMPCGAKLPVIGLFAGAFFGDNAWVGTSMYFAGIFIIFIGALLVNKITGNKARTSFFIIELPEYKLPNVWRAAKSMLSRGWAYIVKAGTVILVCNAAITIMQGYGWNFAPAETPDSSILASIASPIGVLLVPLGFGTWQMASAAVSGFVAKENVVGTLASVYALSNFVETESLSVAAYDAFGISSSAALAYLMFNLFTPPCFAAIGAMNSELKSKKWMLGGISLQLATGYTVAFFVYHTGTLITQARLGTGFFGGLMAVISFAVIISVLISKANKKDISQYSIDADVYKKV